MENTYSRVKSCKVKQQNLIGLHDPLTEILQKSLQEHMLSGEENNSEEQGFVS